MLMSITYIFIFGLLLGAICKKIKFPSLFGMIIAGIAIGPHVLNLIDHSILDISPEIRKIALIIILIRAGLKLSLEDLKKVGRPAILMCFIPATLEILGMIIFAPYFLGLSILDSAILGTVIAAVSPAVIVPKMIKLIDEGYGEKNSIPQMILAGASVDDVYVIVLFTTLLSVPISIITGIGIGFLVGYLLVLLFKKVHMRDMMKVLIMLSVSFTLVTLEDQYSSIIPFASLISIMSFGLMIRQIYPELAIRIASKFDKSWVGAEIFLFVLVGASVQIESALSAGMTTIILLILVLLFRMIGVYISLIKTSLNIKERLFCMLAYTPKATVQAAIGGLPLAMGLGCGNIVLTVSVIAILFTAPLGAFMIDLTYKDFLQ